MDQEHAQTGPTFAIPSGHSQTSMSYYAPSNRSNLSIFLNPGNGSACKDTVPDNGTSCVQDPVERITTVEFVIVVFLTGFIVSIIVGNILVILSVCLFREMRTLTNGLIVSLASADLLVALIVLPISLYNEVMGHWTLGPYVCDFWITSDVFCCTSSILNIVVIAVDRYWLITKNVRYTHNATFPRKRVCIMMGSAAWAASLIISSSPLLGWRKGNEKKDPTKCLISQDIGYTVFSTFGAFWCPLLLIIVVYIQIFKIARRRALSRAKARAVHPSLNSTMMTEINGKGTTAQTRFSRRSDSSSPPNSPSCTHSNSTFNNNAGRKRKFRRRRSDAHAKRTRYRGRLRSSARTLGLIIGCFVLCWLPFFIMATVVPFCSHCIPPHIVSSVVLWLGYSNSLLNPAIYAIWDKNFRRSFKKLVTCDIRLTAIF